MRHPWIRVATLCAVISAQELWTGFIDAGEPVCADWYSLSNRGVSLALPTCPNLTFPLVEGASYATLLNRSLTRSTEDATLSVMWPEFANASRYTGPGIPSTDLGSLIPAGSMAQMARGGHGAQWTTRTMMTVNTNPLRWWVGPQSLSRGISRDAAAMLAARFVTSFRTGVVPSVGATTIQSWNTTLIVDLFGLLRAADTGSRSVPHSRRGQNLPRGSADGVRAWVTALRVTTDATGGVPWPYTDVDVEDVVAMVKAQIRTRVLRLAGERIGVITGGAQRTGLRPGGGVEYDDGQYAEDRRQSAGPAGAYPVPGNATYTWRLLEVNRFTGQAAFLVQEFQGRLRAEQAVPAVSSTLPGVSYLSNDGVIDRFGFVCTRCGELRVAGTTSALPVSKETVRESVDRSVLYRDPVHRDGRGVWVRDPELLETVWPAVFRALGLDDNQDMSVRQENYWNWTTWAPRVPADGSWRPIQAVASVLPFVRTVLPSIRFVLKAVEDFFAALPWPTPSMSTVFYGQLQVDAWCVFNGLANYCPVGASGTCVWDNASSAEVRAATCDVTADHMAFMYPEWGALKRAVDAHVQWRGSADGLSAYTAHRAVVLDWVRAFVSDPHHSGFMTLCGGLGGYEVCSEGPGTTFTDLLTPTCIGASADPAVMPTGCRSVAEDGTGTASVRCVRAIGRCFYGLPSATIDWHSTACVPNAPDNACTSVADGVTIALRPVNDSVWLAAARAARARVVAAAGDSVALAPPPPFIHPITGHRMCGLGTVGILCDAYCGDVSLIHPQWGVTRSFPSNACAAIRGDGTVNQDCYAAVTAGGAVSTEPCNGHGVCDRESSVRACQCDPGVLGIACTMCEASRYGYNATNLGCPYSCAAPLVGDARDGTDADLVQRNALVWDAGASTGVFSRGFFCSDSPTGTSLASHPECGLDQPVDTPDAWIARLNGCVGRVVTAPRLIPLAVGGLAWAWSTARTCAYVPNTVTVSVLLGDPPVNTSSLCGATAVAANQRLGFTPNSTLWCEEAEFTPPQANVTGEMGAGSCGLTNDELVALVGFSPYAVNETGYVTQGPRGAVPILNDWGRCINRTQPWVMYGQPWFSNTCAPRVSLHANVLARVVAGVDRSTGASDRRTVASGAAARCPALCDSAANMYEHPLFLNVSAALHWWNASAPATAGSVPAAGVPRDNMTFQVDSWGYDDVNATLRQRVEYARRVIVALASANSTTNTVNTSSLLVYPERYPGHTLHRLDAALPMWRAYQRLYRGLTKVGYWGCPQATVRRQWLTNPSLCLPEAFLSSDLDAAAPFGIADPDTSWVTRAAFRSTVPGTGSRVAAVDLAAFWYTRQQGLRRLSWRQEDQRALQPLPSALSFIGEGSNFRLGNTTSWDQSAFLAALQGIEFPVASVNASADNGTFVMQRCVTRFVSMFNLQDCHSVISAVWNLSAPFTNTWKAIQEPRWNFREGGPQAVLNARFTNTAPAEYVAWAPIAMEWRDPVTGVAIPFVVGGDGWVVPEHLARFRLYTADIPENGAPLVGQPSAGQGASSATLPVTPRACVERASSTWGVDCDQPLSQSIYSYYTAVGISPDTLYGCPAALLGTGDAGLPVLDAAFAGRVFMLAGFFSLPRGDGGMSSVAAHPCGTELFYLANPGNVTWPPPPPGDWSMPAMLEVVRAVMTTLSIVSGQPTVSDSARTVATRLLGIPEGADVVGPLQTMLVDALQWTYPCDTFLTTFNSLLQTSSLVLTPVRVDVSVSTICGGPRRAATCVPGSGPGVTAATCAAAGFVPCGRAHNASAAMFCACRPNDGCVCAPGANLDPAHNCVRCLPGTFPTSTPFVRCVLPEACFTAAHATSLYTSPPVCSDHGRCVLFMRNSTGQRVIEYNAATVVADVTGYTTVSPSCLCDAGWSGDVCSVAIPPPVFPLRLDAATRMQQDGGTMATSRHTSTYFPCAASSLFISTTWLEVYKDACGREASRADGDVAYGECLRSAREVAMRPFYRDYNYRAYLPQASTVRHTRYTDVEECELAGATLASVSQFTAASPSERMVYARFWGEYLQGDVFTATLSEEDVDWVRSGPRGAWFMPVVNITDYRFCVRLLGNDSSVKTFFIPVTGVLVQAQARLSDVTDVGMYPLYATGALAIDEAPGADACDYYAAPLCHAYTCEPGKSRRQVDSGVFSATFV
jgi:hypothetical protein